MVPVKLTDFALRLAKVKAWLQLPSPADEGDFPYRLVLKNAATGKLTVGGMVYEGDSYGLVLVRDPKKRQGERRYVYAFALDNAGRSQLLYASQNNEDGLLPAIRSSFPQEIELGSAKRFTISAPFGVDTYMLLTTAQPIPDPSVLTFDGVRSGDRDARGGSGLQGLINKVMRQNRGSTVATPVDWSLQRICLESRRR